MKSDQLQPFTVGSKSGLMHMNEVVACVKEQGDEINTLKTNAANRLFHVTVTGAFNGVRGFFIAAAFTEPEEL